MYSLKEAAEAAGRSKAAILRAIQKGRFSATRNGLGEWVIDPSELHRVYKPVTRNGDSINESNQSVTDGNHPATRVETEGLRREISLLKEHLEREKEISRNLFHYLDEEKEERRKLTLVLTHQTKEQDTQKKSTNFIGRIFRRK